MDAEPTFAAPDDSPTGPASPCCGLCRLDRRVRWCVGCGRTASEIARWPAAGHAERLTILGKLPGRLQALRSRGR